MYYLHFLKEKYLPPKNAIENIVLDPPNEAGLRNTILRPEVLSSILCHDDDDDNIFPTHHSFSHISPLHAFKYKEFETI